MHLKKLLYLFTFQIGSTYFDYLYQKHQNNLCIFYSISSSMFVQTAELSNNEDNTDSIQSENISENRRSSSISEILPTTEESNSDQILGTLHCTIRYSFDKNALVVTVNRCENLPAKDSTAKSRFVLDYFSTHIYYVFIVILDFF